MAAHPGLAAAQSALQRGDLESCYRAATAVLAGAPGNAEASCLAGLALLRAGHAKEALPLLQRAHSAAPTDQRLLLALGESGFHLGDPAGARAWFSKAVSLDPSAQALTGLALAHRMLNELEEAVDAGNRVLALAPDDRQATEIVLGALQESGRSEDALELMRAAMGRRPGDAHLQQLATFPYLYTQTDPGPLAALLRELGAKLARVCPRLWESYDNTPDPDRKLRVGYVSREFHNRWAPRFIGPLIDLRDGSRFELFCYYQTLMDSEKVAQKSPNATWRDTTGMSDVDFAKLVRQDGIDVLVDLMGWIAGSRLAAYSLAPAPVQITYLGFPATTGLPAMGYRIIDSITDPPGAEAFASEELVRMPACFLCPRANISPPVAPPPCTTGAPFTFGSFNTMTKICTPVLDLWARVLAAVPGSRLILKNIALGREPVRARVHDALHALGVSPDRVDLRGEVLSESEHLASYSQVDVALDPFPYNGTTTTFDALWMGVPVVTLRGHSHLARVTASMLINAGYPELVTETPEAYVDLCRSLASDRPGLAAPRASQRDQVARSPLCDAPTFVRALESRYRDLWARWCQSPPVS